jgi:hypothetical protein
MAGIMWISSPDGLFEFRTYKLDEDGWVPTHHSGRYGQANSAESEATKMLARFGA